MAQNDGSESGQAPANFNQFRQSVISDSDFCLPPRRQTPFLVCFFTGADLPRREAFEFSAHSSLIT
jgi:hypothetical protein